MNRVINSGASPFQRVRAAGFTLIELMIVIVVVVILGSLAAPSFNDFIVKNRVKGAAEDIYGLILQARSEGPIRDTDIFVKVDPTAWCVGYATTANCDCTGTVTCTVDVAGQDVTQVVSGAEHDNVTIAGGNITFAQPRGTATSQTINVTSGDWGLNVVVNGQGRVNVCNPNSNVMTGYEAC